MKRDTFPEDSIHVTRFKDGEQNGVGLTKREYFAVMAMQGMLANHKNGYDKKAAITYAEDSVYVADALISELNKTKQ